jgi:SAM-dependent MidA family methyltransferase
MAQPVDSADCIELRHLLATRIAAHPQQRVTFKTFMEWVLYEPSLGYYAANRQKIGAGGDFVTSPHLGLDFGELLAEQFLDLWLSLERPNPFQVVEMGAGQGLIAADVLKYLCESSAPRVRTRQSPPSDYAAFWQALEYIIVEKSPAFIAEQQNALKPFVEAERKLAWRTWEELPNESIVGCFFSNELVDAFPVHRIEIQAGQLQEVYVATSESDPTQFVEVVSSPSTSELQSYLDELGVDLNAYEDGYRSEINLETLSWLKTVAQKIYQGYVLTIDYGYTSAQYYSPQRPQGTLQCYYQQAHHADPYWAIGHQDLTAHVNFTALESHGQQCKLETLGFTQQGLFLMALGLGDRLNANTNSKNLDLMDILRRRDALHALMNPLGLGGFGVLLQGKRLPPAGQTYRFKGFRAEAPFF